MKKDLSYQRIVDYLRRRHNLSRGDGWSGLPVGSPAVSRYPNIAAELAASRHWAKTYAEFAGVSPEIMAAVIEDGECLTCGEQLQLAYRLYERNPDYIVAPVLQIVDPETNKGKFLRRQLNELMDKAAALPDPVVNVYRFKTYWRHEAADVCDSLNAGNAVTYADWRWACSRIWEALEAEESKKHKARTSRIKWSMED